MGISLTRERYNLRGGLCHCAPKYTFIGGSYTWCALQELNGGISNVSGVQILISRSLCIYRALIDPGGLSDIKMIYGILPVTICAGVSTFPSGFVSTSSFSYSSSSFIQPPHAPTLIKREIFWRNIPEEWRQKRK